MDIVLTSKEMKGCDTVTIEEHQVPAMVLMERAAMVVVDEIKQRFDAAQKVAVLCGCGNNGGDGLAVARILTELGFVVDVYLVMPDGQPSPEYLQQLAILKHYPIAIHQLSDGESIDYFEEGLKHQYHLLVDAIFGIGLNRILSDRLVSIIKKVNHYRHSYKVIAIDVPSGLDSDTARVYGTAVLADITVALAYVKTGLILANAREFVGKLVVGPIGINRNSLRVTPTRFCNLSSYRSTLMPRRHNTHKGSFGKLLLIAGNETMVGACYLAAKATYKTGVGLVYVLTHSQNLTLLKQQLPECIVQAYNKGDQPDFASIDDLMARCDVTLIGCGLGQSQLSEAICSYVLENDENDKVIDADALNFLSKGNNNILKKVKGRWVITPHLIEFSRLLGLNISEIDQDILSYVENYSKEQGCLAVVKSASTIVSDGKMTFINTCGNNGMATGGSGDVLAGILAAGLSQAVHACEFRSHELWQLICGMVELHSIAGDLARDAVSEYSLMATDIIDYIPVAIRKQIELTF